MHDADMRSELMIEKKTKLITYFSKMLELVKIVVQQWPQKFFSKKKVQPFLLKF